MNIKIIFAILVMILLSTVGIFAIFQNSSFQTEGLWWATIECVGWVDESGQHRSGYPSGGELGVFYDGERIKGCDWTYTLKGSSGYPCQKWKVEMEIHWDSLSGPLIGSWSDSGGALATGDSVLAELDFNILLDQDKDVVAHFAGSIYNSQVGWETTVSGGRYCNVESNDPALSLESYSLDKTSVQPGDEVTATFSIKNSGRAASTNTKIALYPDPNDFNQWYGAEYPTYYYEAGISIAVDQTITKSKAFIVAASDVQSDGDIHVGLDVWTPGYAQEIHDERVIDLVTIEPPDNPPSQPSNPEPANGATSVDNSVVVLHWSCSDIDGDPLTYNVYFGMSPSPPLVSQGITDTQYTVGSVGDDTPYYWKIYAYDGELGTYGPVWAFSTGTGNHPPSIPSNPDPSNGQTDVSDGSITLYWDGGDPDGDAVTYYVYFGTDSMPTALVSTQQSTHWKTPDLDSSTNYYWKIDAKDGSDMYSYGPTWFFTTEGVTPPANQPPEISDDSGNLNLKAGEMITIWVRATDDHAVTSALIEINGEQKGQMSYNILQTRWEYTFIAPESGNSQITYAVTVYDEAELSDSISRYIFIDFSQHSTLIDQITQLVLEYWQYILIGFAVLLIIVLLSRRRPKQPVVVYPVQPR